MKGAAGVRGKQLSPEQVELRRRNAIRLNLAQYAVPGGALRKRARFRSRWRSHRLGRRGVPANDGPWAVHTANSSETGT